MPVFKITDTHDPRVAPYVSMTDAQLRQRAEKDFGILIAESPKVIHAALDMGMTPLSLLCEERHLEGDARAVIERCPQLMPVYTGQRHVLSQLTGYTLTRGVLCAMQRPSEISLSDVCQRARRLAVIDGVCDTTNIGSIFRAAAALGIDGIVLTRTSCDPLNRRSIRVSMGTVFRLPWAWVNDPVADLKEYGFVTLAMALKKDSVCIDDPVLLTHERLAIILGTEGDGLAQSVIDCTDYTVLIPMQRGVDSLNVASAAALAFWQLRIR